MINKKLVQGLIIGSMFILVGFFILWDTDIINIIGLLFGILGSMILTYNCLMIGKNLQSNTTYAQNPPIRIKDENIIDIFGVRK